MTHHKHEQDDNMQMRDRLFTLHDQEVSMVVDGFEDLILCKISEVHDDHVTVIINAGSETNDLPGDTPIHLRVSSICALWQDEEGANTHEHEDGTTHSHG